LRQDICKIFVINGILDQRPRSDISNILRNHWKCVHSLRSVYCAVNTKQAHRLQTGLCLRHRNATKAWRKWKGSYDSVRQYRSERERLPCRKFPGDQYANGRTVLPI